MLLAEPYLIASLFLQIIKNAAACHNFFIDTVVGATTGTFGGEPAMNDLDAMMTGLEKSENDVY